MKNYRIVNGRKLMWDGQGCESKEAAEEAVSRYRADGFETEIFEEEGKYFVHTRREVKAAAVGQPA